MIHCSNTKDDVDLPSGLLYLLKLRLNRCILCIRISAQQIVPVLVEANGDNLTEALETIRPEGPSNGPGVTVSRPFQIVDVIAGLPPSTLIWEKARYIWIHHIWRSKEVNMVLRTRTCLPSISWLGRPSRSPTV